MQGEGASHKQLAQALANQEAAKLAASGGGSEGERVVKQIRTYQERILELESQVTMQAKAIKAQNEASNGKSGYSRQGVFSACKTAAVVWLQLLHAHCIARPHQLTAALWSQGAQTDQFHAGSVSHEQNTSSRHPSVTPFTPSIGSHAVAGIVSPKRPPGVLNKDNPPEAALSKKLSVLTSDLHRKEEQIASLTDEKGKAGTMKKQYDKLVADLLKQAETLKSKHSELHKKYEESNVCFPQPSGFNRSQTTCERAL